MHGFLTTPCLHNPLTPAVQRCCEARNAVLAEIAGIPEPTETNPFYDRARFRKAFTTDYYANKEASVEASNAFTSSMPDLSNRQNIRDYIACVLHGLAIQVIDQSAASRMIAGARIAATLLKEDQASTQNEVDPLPSLLPLLQKISGK